MRSGITLAHTHSGRGTVRKELEDSAVNNGKRHVCRKKKVYIAYGMKPILEI